MSFLKKLKEPHSSDHVDVDRIIDENTPFAICEAFKAMYSKVLYLPVADNCKKIAITSYISGEGKTYVSTNFAITLAQNLNKRILLIDMDMRKPRVMRLLQKYISTNKEGYGLSEYLVGIHSEPYITKTSLDNLDIVLSGKEVSNPTGLISSPKMDQFIKTCEQSYDYVLFDCPPVGIVSDALLLNDKLNGYILTARANYSNIDDLDNAVNDLKNLGAEVFGIVLTATNPKINKKTYKRYANTYEKSVE